MPLASQFTAGHLSMKQPPCVCLGPGLLGCLGLRYVLLSGRLWKNNLAEKGGWMALQCEFLELDFQSEGGTEGATQATQIQRVSLHSPGIRWKTGNRVTVELSGSHRDIHGLHRYPPFVCVAF